VKLILIIVPPDAANRLIDLLIEHEFRATRIDSVGGFLKKGNSSVAVGVAEEYVEEAVKLIRASATHANVFVLNVARYERL